MRRRPTVDFAVTLSPAASEEVTVRYATRDGTARKGEDYRRTRGTLTFAPGETERTVSVPVIDDAVDEGEETFTLRLSRATGVARYDNRHRRLIAQGDSHAGKFAQSAIFYSRPGNLFCAKRKME